VGFLELLHSLRGKDSSGKVVSWSKRGGHETILAQSRGVSSGFRWSRRGQDSGDLDGQVVADVNDPSGKREPFLLVSLLEVIDLLLNLLNGERESRGGVRYHVIHLERVFAVETIVEFVEIGEHGWFGMHGFG
jgi:hypothetical protein